MRSCSRRVRRRSVEHPTAPTERYARYYKMDHQKRGIALIFNHEFFTVSLLENRTGTNVDCDELVATLKSFGFEVKDFHNLSYKAIGKALDEVAQMDHTNHDCLTVAVLSHGGPDFVYAHNMPYNPKEIWGRFTTDKCPSLAGKPKLFFIQACRGKEWDAGSSMQQRTKNDGPEAPKFRIPSQADFLISYSTPPGFASWRNEECGSWFIQSLCEEFRKNGTRDDILTLLTFVSQRVALSCQASKLGIDDDRRVRWVQWKQVPCITSMLTRLLKFPEPPKARTAADDVQDGA